MNNRSINRQGIAIVSVLIVIALISASASLMFQRFDRDLNQTHYIISQNQALNHLYSTETWVKTILSSDDQSVDHLNEVWSTLILPIQVQGGSIYGKLSDLQSRLNLNNLIDLSTDIYSPKYRSFFYDCTNRINTQLEQQAMADAIFSYVVNQNFKPKLFEHHVELKNVQSISLEDYIKFEPFIIALPAVTSINVNTASKEALSCIHPQLSASLVAKVIQKRKRQAFASVDDFWIYAHSLLPNLTLDKIKESLPPQFINTTSSYFLLETKIIIDENKLIGRTILHRKDGKITIMNRSYRQVL